MDVLMRHILATICYHDATNCSMSSFDVWKNLSVEDVDAQEQYKRNYAIQEVLDILEKLVRDGRLICTDGLYTLPKRHVLCQKRKQANRISSEKLNAMSKAIQYMRFLPFVRMVLATGRVSAKTASKSSDWDVLIILKKNYIWIGRFIVTVLTQILGRRRTDNHHADRICLNYWITTSSMKISLDDRFSAYEYMTARVLFSSINPSRFLAENHWIKRFCLHFDEEILSSQYRIYDTKVSHGVRHFFETIFGFSWMEKVARKIQREKILKNPKTFKRGSMIVANDNELIFLPSPQSPKVFKKYCELCKREGLFVGV